MSSTEYSPEERDFPHPGRHSAPSYETHYYTHFQKQNNLQRSPSLHLLALLNFQLHAARVSAQTKFAKIIGNRFLYILHILHRSNIEQNFIQITDNK